MDDLIRSFEEIEDDQPSDGCDDVEREWPEYVDTALRGIGFGAIQQAGGRVPFVRRFTERWGGIELDAFVRALHEAEGEERLFALLALGETHTSQAQVELLPLLENGEPIERWVSAICLGDMRVSEALPFLCAMLTEFLPGRLKDYLDSAPSSPFEFWRSAIPRRLELLGDRAAIPPLRHALGVLVDMLGQHPQAGDEQALKPVRLNKSGMKYEDVMRVKQFYSPSPATILQRVWERRRSKTGQGVDALLPRPGAIGYARRQPELNNLFEYQDSIVYTLGRLGALGALTDLEVTKPLSLLWAVHMLMAHVHDRYERSDIFPALSPTLEMDLRKQLHYYYGLTTEEQEQALGAYMLTKSTHIWRTYSRERDTERMNAGRGGDGPSEPRADMWDKIAFDQQWERMLGFTLPVNDRLIVIAYDGLDVIDLHNPRHSVFDDRYPEGKGVYEWGTQVLDYGGLRYRVLGLFGGEPLLKSKYGEAFMVDTANELLTVYDASGVPTLTHHYVDASGDWLSATFSSDSNYVLLGIPYVLYAFRRIERGER